jgi:hypothetical protein
MKRLFLALLCFLALLSSHQGTARAVAGIGPVLTVSPSASGPVGPPVSGYTIWLNAPYASNTSTTWHDLSGNGYNVTVAGGTAPVLSVAAINGLAAYTFAGTTTYTLFETGAVPQASANFAVFVAFRCTNTALYSGPADANYVYDWSMQYSTTWGPEYWSAGSDYLSSGSTNTGPHVMALTRSSVSGQATAWLDGTALSTYTANAPYSGLAAPRVIGNFGYNSQTFNGAVGEFIEYDLSTALTTAQINSINSYLISKWGAP